MEGKEELQLNKINKLVTGTVGEGGVKFKSIHKGNIRHAFVGCRIGGKAVCMKTPEKHLIGYNALSVYKYPIPLG